MSILRLRAQQTRLVAQRLMGQSMQRAALLTTPVSRSSSVSSFSAVKPFALQSRSFTAISDSKPSDFSTIPIIDISSTFPLFTDATKNDILPTPTAQARSVIDALHRAYTEVGFIVIVGHQIPQSKVDAIMSSNQSYFDHEDKFKNQIPMTDSYPYGYSGFGGENLSKGYDASGKPDPKESFCIGPGNPAAEMPPRAFPNSPANFQKAWEEYYSAMENLAAHLLKIMSVSLKVPPSFFLDKITHHRSALRALNYPAIPNEHRNSKEVQIRAGAHTDYGTVTILLQDATGGLQAQNRKGQWIDVPPIPGSYVINLGDLMARWTNDNYVSTVHRVVQPPSSEAISKRRMSLAFFHNLNADSIVECIPSCTSLSNPAKYPPKKAWDLLIEKHSASVKY